MKKLSGKGSHAANEGFNFNAITKVEIVDERKDIATVLKPGTSTHTLCWTLTIGAPRVLA